MLLDEFRTSCISNGKLLENQIEYKQEKDKMIANNAKNTNASVIRTDKNGNEQHKKLHAVLISNIFKTASNTYVLCYQNRNKNGVKNFRYIFNSYRTIGRRPEIFTRKVELID